MVSDAATRRNPTCVEPNTDLKLRRDVGECLQRTVRRLEAEAMPKRARPAVTEPSEHWVCVLVNDRTELLNDHIAGAFG